MRTIYLIFLLLSSVQFSKGQESQAKDFYLHLAKALETVDSDSIILTTINYGCLGMKTSWNAKIKKIGDSVKIDYYRQRPEDITNDGSKLETILDTTFTVKTAILKKNLEEEIVQITSRPVFIEASFKISVNQGTSNKEFAFRRGEGLYYLLRFNKTWTTYFATR